MRQCQRTPPRHSLSLGDHHRRHLSEKIVARSCFKRPFPTKRTPSSWISTNLSASLPLRHFFTEQVHTAQRIKNKIQCKLSNPPPAWFVVVFTAFYFVFLFYYKTVHKMSKISVTFGPIGSRATFTKNM